MAFALLEEIPAADKKRGVKKTLAYRPALDEPEALESAELLHTESCPEGCCDVKIVTRYFLKTA